MVPDTHSQLRWFPLHDLPANVVDLAGTAIRHCAHSQRLSSTMSDGGDVPRSCSRGDATGSEHRAGDPVGYSALESQKRFRSDIAAAVAAFHAAFDLPRQTRPTLDVDESLAKLRIALLQEELGELVTASSARDLVAVADALADIVYVAYGTALTYGIDLDLVLGEVHRSNMSKLDSTGKALKRKDGKVLKSDQYFPPDVAAVLKLQSSRQRL
jgi:predicted HAD superfamily Cof-like phosphohydrolase